VTLARPFGSQLGSPLIVLYRPQRPLYRTARRAPVLVERWHDKVSPAIALAGGTLA